MDSLWNGRWRGLTLQIERRRARDGGGPTLRVLAPEAEGAAREWLRFDAFERQPHWHFDPEGEDEIRPLDERVDPIAEAFDRLTQETASLLERAGAPEALVRTAAVSYTHLTLPTKA